MNLDKLKKAASRSLALMIAIAAPAVFAQSVSIGGTTLKLGASRAAALAEANAQFKLSPSRINGQYNLYPKAAPGSTQQPGSGAIGSITIDNNRLARVTRNLGTFRSANGERAIQNLIAAFSQAPGQGRTPSIHTDSSITGNASLQRVYFSYPDRVIQVVVYEPADQSEPATIDITEQYALRGNGAPMESAPPAQSQ